MITYRQLAVTLNHLELDRSRPVIMHASLSSFGQVMGGAETLLGAVVAATGGLMMPAFTYKTMVTPEVGPPDNGILYGGDTDRNLMAEFYRPDMPVDPLIGRVADALRRHPRARRSMHPILSFAGVNVDEALASQTIDDPLAPIAALEEQGGWVLMVGVDHTTNTSLHYAEKLAGRKTFVRWALTQQGVVECPGFPGSSLGFRAAEPYLERITRRATIGNARIQALPLEEMAAIVIQLLEKDPLALLPDDTDDLRVQDTRKAARG